MIPHQHPSTYTPTFFFTDIGSAFQKITSLDHPQKSPPGDSPEPSDDKYTRIIFGNFR
jgi:hypothetical protein